MNKQLPQNAGTGTLPAVGSTETENILDAAKQDAGYEALLKFRKGDFLIGDEPLSLGTEFIAHVIGWTKCWIKFVDGEVADRRVYRIALGERPPERDELDDLDQGNWPEGLGGRPADPWSLQYLLPLERTSNGEVVIFTTSSFGGRRAVADLCAAYARRVAKNAAGGQPIVKLGKVEMPTKRFGKVPRPHFEIVGWDEPPLVEVEEGPPPVISGGEFEDSIPF
jgi:hypothetical protein